MRTVIDIAINDLRILFKDRSIWINLVIVPLVISYVIGYAMSGGSGGAASLIVDVIDADNGALAQQFQADVRAANHMELSIREAALKGAAVPSGRARRQPEHRPVPAGRRRLRDKRRCH